MKTFRRCTRCIMDNASDDLIWFNDDGHCNYCEYALKTQNKVYFPNETGEKRLAQMIKKVKIDGNGKKYDCIMGISGGLDSAYLLYLGHLWGLKILAVHIDDGFDEFVATENISKLCEKIGINLITIKPEKNQYNDLLRAYILANVPNLAIPQDNILFSHIYKFAQNNDIKYFLSGSNFSLENIIQRGNSHNANDLTNLRDIYKKFGRGKIDKLPMMSALEKDFRDVYFKLKTLTPLNFINYERQNAIKELEDFCGFKYYGSKHLENRFTKFLQLYWLPTKYNDDKRKSHLSSMIVTKQMDRNEALKIFSEPLYEEEKMKVEIKNILEEIELDEDVFYDIMQKRGKQHNEYKVSKYVTFRTNFAILKRKIMTKQRD